MINGYWENKNVLVTGGTGFIGSFLIRGLTEKNANVICLTDKSNSNSLINTFNLRGRCKIVIGDILQSDLVNDIIKEYKITELFHLASQSLIPESIQRPALTLDINIRGTVNVLEACRKNTNIKSIIMLSSIGAYDPSGELPFDENSALKGDSPYNASKSCMDIICQSYAKTYNIPISIVRFSNIFGEGDLNFDRLVPRTLKNLFEGKDLILRDSGNQLRGYLYVEDAVSALILLAEKVSELNLIGEAFNFGPEKPTPIYEIVNKIVLNADISKYNIRLDDENIKGVKDQYHSAGKAKKILGWKIHYTLDEGLDRTVQWYKKYLKTKNSIEGV